MGGRGAAGSFPVLLLDITGNRNKIGVVSPLITAGLMELRGNEADPESTLQNIDRVRFNGLEHEQLFVVDQEGFVIKGYDGTENSVAFDTESARQWKGLTVTHRHPGEDGGTFSIPDICNVAKYNWGVHEASAREGRYRIEATHKADSEALASAIAQGLPKVQGEMKAEAERMAKALKKDHISEKDYERESYKAQLGVLERWYEEILPKAGYQYKFIPRKEE